MTYDQARLAATEMQGTNTPTWRGEVSGGSLQEEGEEKERGSTGCAGGLESR